MKNAAAIRNDAGFTLLEVLVATLIMGIAVTGLIVGLSQSVHNASRLAEYDHVSMLARTKMSDLLLDRGLPFEGAANGQFTSDQSGGAAAGWRAVTKPFDAPPNAQPGTIILQQIALEVWWQPESGSKRTLRVDGYRPAVIPSPVAP
jgi:general secretion pathway protein I